MAVSLNIAVLTTDAGSVSAVNTKSALEECGHTVTIIAAADITTSDLSGYDVLVRSRLFLSTPQMAQHIADAGVPVVGPAEGAVAASGDGDLTDPLFTDIWHIASTWRREDTSPNQRDIQIIEPNHPITDAWYRGSGVETPVYLPSTFFYGVLTSESFVGTPLALGDANTNSNNAYVLLAIEAGTPDLDGYPIPVRTVVCTLGYANQGSGLRPVGISILNSCVLWAAGVQETIRVAAQAWPPSSAEEHLEQYARIIRHLENEQMAVVWFHDPTVDVSEYEGYDVVWSAARLSSNYAGALARLVDLTQAGYPIVLGMLTGSQGDLPATIVDDLKIGSGSLATSSNSGEVLQFVSDARDHPIIAPFSGVDEVAVWQGTVGDFSVTIDPNAPYVGQAIGLVGDGANAGNIQILAIEPQGNLDGSITFAARIAAYGFNFARNRSVTPEHMILVAEMIKWCISFAAPGTILLPTKKTSARILATDAGQVETRWQVRAWGTSNWDTLVFDSGWGTDWLYEIEITGLEENTQYTYRLLAKDALGREAESPGFDFVTGWELVTDFGEYAVDSKLEEQGWGELLVGPNFSTWRIVERADSLSGKVVERFRVTISADALDPLINNSASQLARNQEVRASFRYRSFKSGDSRDGSIGGVVLRAHGPTGTPFGECYVLTLRTSEEAGDTIAISAVYTVGLQTDLLEELDSMPFPHQQDTWYELRMQAIGSTIRAKVWQYGTVEPDDWMLVASDFRHPMGTGGIYGTGVSECEWQRLIIVHEGVEAPKAANIVIVTADTGHVSVQRTMTALTAGGYTVTAVHEDDLDLMDMSQVEAIVEVYATAMKVAPKLRALLDQGKPMLLSLYSHGVLGGLSRTSTPTLMGLCDPVTIFLVPESGGIDSIVPVGSHEIVDGFPKGTPTQVKEAPDRCGAVDLGGDYAGTRLSFDEALQLRTESFAIELGELDLNGRPMMSRVAVLGFMFAGDSDYTAEGRLLLQQALAWILGDSSFGGDFRQFHAVTECDSVVIAAYNLSVMTIRFRIARADDPSFSDPVVDTGYGPGEMIPGTAIMYHRAEGLEPGQYLALVDATGIDGSVQSEPIPFTILGLGAAFLGGWRAGV